MSQLKRLFIHIGQGGDRRQDNRVHAQLPGLISQRFLQPGHRAAIGQIDGRARARRSAEAFCRRSGGHRAASGREARQERCARIDRIDGAASL
jgi:hypothetical protein